MKIWTLSLILLMASSVVFPGCQPANKNTETRDTAKVDRPKTNQSGETSRAALENEIQTAMFIETAAQGGMLTVALGKLAADKANHRGVKEFGNLMVKSHTEINDQLKVLASAKKFKLPFTLAPAQSKQVRQMAKMKTAYFEKLYMRMMVQYHNKHIELFKGAGSSPDTAVSNFSRKYLPVLMKHRVQALKIRGEIN